MTRYYRLKAAGLCTQCGKNAAISSQRHCEPCHSLILKRAKAYRIADPARQAEYRKTFFRAIKDRAYAILGEVCSCCGEQDRRFLTLDHVHNDGYKDKKRRQNLTYLMYREVAVDGVVGKYQILCWNCNCGKRVNGGICPHQTIFKESFCGRNINN